MGLNVWGFFSFCLELSKSAMKIDQNQKKKGSILELLKFSLEILFHLLFSLHELYFMLVYRLMCFADNCLLKIDK